MASMLPHPKKKTGRKRKERYENPPPATPAHTHALQALSIGNTRKVPQRGMLSNTLRKKKRHKAQHATRLNR